MPSVRLYITYSVYTTKLFLTRFFFWIFAYDKDVVIKKEKMFVEIHFHLLILEEKERSCFCQMEWVLEKKRMRIAGD